MKRLYRNPSFLQALLTVWLVLLYLPILNIMEIPTPNGTIPVSFCYLFSVAFIPLLIFKLPKLRIPPWYITGLYAFVIVWAVIQYPARGFSKGILHWVFGAYVLLVLANMKDELDNERILKVLETGVLVFFACHLVFNAINWRDIYNIIANGEGGLSLSSLTRGGRNLDASWLALGCFFVRNKKLRIGCLLYSFAYAVIGVSRVGLAASGICLLWILVYDKKFGFNKKTALIWLGIAAAGIGASFALGIGQRMISKLIGQGEFGDSSGKISFLMGREYMWKNVLPMFKEFPLGVGAGNAIPVMRESFGFCGYEDVVHNVLFQLLLDEGFVGALWMLCLVFMLFFNQCRRGRWFRSPFAAYFLTYLALALVQFHGGEVLMIFVMGCCILAEDKTVCLRLPWKKAEEPQSEQLS